MKNGVGKIWGCLNDFITMSTETTMFNTSQVLRFPVPLLLLLPARPSAVLRKLPLTFISVLTFHFPSIPLTHGQLLCSPARLLANSNAI